MDFACEDDIQRDTLAACIGTLNHTGPLPITWLGYLCFGMPLGYRNDHSTTDNAHYKACLVEIVDFRLDDAVIGDCVVYEVESSLGND